MLFYRALIFVLFLLVFTYIPSGSIKRYGSLMFILPPIALVSLLGYLLGSIPFGLLITWIAGAGDLRSIGSGNIGATNVLRTGRKDLAAATLLLDALKGTIAVLIADWISPTSVVLAAFSAFLGHVAPIWLRFNGGKGVATFLGALLGLYWPVGIFFCLVWLLVAFIWRYSSLAALVASCVSTIAFAVLQNHNAAYVVALMSAILWFKHRENIKRLYQGTESKIGQK